MDQALAQLIARYPRLFHNEAPLAQSTVEIGWAPIIEDLLRDIDALLTDTQAQAFGIWQIKEKVGELRFYFTVDRFGAQSEISGRSTRQVTDTVGGRFDVQTLRDEVERLTDAARERSSRTCVKCGQPGQRSTALGWVATLCKADE